jgi:hypothetical protein
MSWIITGSQKTDPDALAYLAEVERVDGQALESGVRDAVIAFVVGCKSDGIWSAIKASCILAGARTTNGALVPLVGTAPTPFNFDLIGNTDYNRKTGLKGDGSTKYLDSNRANNADPQNSVHRAVWVFSAPTLASANYFGSDGSATVGADNLFRTVSGELAGNCRGTGIGAGFTINNEANTTGFKGINRSTSSNYSVRTSGSNTLVSLASSIATTEKQAIFCRTPSSPIFHSDARLSFYSIGESLDLALLDTRVTTLINSIAAAIP